MSDNVHIVTGPSSNKPGGNKWLIFIIPTLIMVILFLFVLFSSGKYSNKNPQSSRNISQNKNGKVVPTNVQETFTTDDFQIQEALEPGKNTYYMIGTFSKVDPNAKLISIKGKSGKVYLFNIKNYILPGAEKLLQVFVVADKQALTTGKVPDFSAPPPQDESSYFTQSILYSLDNEGSTADLSEIAVRWNDFRTASQIITDYQSKPGTPLNETYPDSVILAKFK